MFPLPSPSPPSPLPLPHTSNWFSLSPCLPLFIFPSFFPLFALSPLVHCSPSLLPFVSLLSPIFSMLSPLSFPFPVRTLPSNTSPFSSSLLSPIFLRLPLFPYTWLPSFILTPPTLLPAPLPTVVTAAPVTRQAHQHTVTPYLPRLSSNNSPLVYPLTCHSPTRHLSPVTHTLPSILYL